jgi:hypothetical protein
MVDLGKPQDHGDAPTGLLKKKSDTGMEEIDDILDKARAR